MLSNIDDELLEYLENFIKSAFASKDDILENFTYALEDYFSEEELPSEEEIEAFVDAMYAKHALKESGNNFKRLVKIFNNLNAEKIIAIHDAGYTKQDGIYEAKSIAEYLKNKGIKPIGFCFYHDQDINRAIDDDICNLFLCFESMEETDETAIRIGEKIVELIEAEGFTTTWNHTVEQRISIDNFKWDKAYDNVDYSSDTVAELIISLS